MIANGTLPYQLKLLKFGFGFNNFFVSILQITDLTCLNYLSIWENINKPFPNINTYTKRIIKKYIEIQHVEYNKAFV